MWLKQDNFADHWDENIKGVWRRREIVEHGIIYYFVLSHPLDCRIPMTSVAWRISQVTILRAAIQ